MQFAAQWTGLISQVMTPPRPGLILKPAIGPFVGGWQAVQLKWKNTLIEAIYGK